MNTMHRWRHKAQTDRNKFQTATVGQLITATQYGEIPPAMNHQQAVAQFQSWMYAATMINAKACAATPLRLYMRKVPQGSRTVRTRGVKRSRRAFLMGDGDIQPSASVMAKIAQWQSFRGGDFEEVTDPHPMLNLLREVNAWQNGFEQTMLRFIYQGLTGNAYIHPVLDSMGLPGELWTLPSQWVNIVPGDKNDDPYIRGYTYGRNKRDERLFESDEVIHFKRPNPGNGVSSMYYGMGDVEAAWSALSLQNQKRLFDVNTFKNNARPDFIMTVNESGVTEDQLREYERKVERRLRGTRNSGRPFATSGNVTITPLSFAPKDLGDQTRVLEEIAAITGVPVSMLLANDPNLASAQVGFSAWREHTVLPLLRMDEEVLNQSYGPMWPDFSDNAFFAYDNPVPADKVHELNRAVQGVDKWITVNEQRVADGLEPLDDAKFDTIGGSQPANPFGLPSFGGFGNEPEPEEPEQPDEEPAEGDDVEQRSIEKVGEMFSKVLEKVGEEMAQLRNETDQRTKHAMSQIQPKQQSGWFTPTPDVIKAAGAELMYRSQRPTEPQPAPQHNTTVVLPDTLTHEIKQHNPPPVVNVDVQPAPVEVIVEAPVVNVPPAAVTVTPEIVMPDRSVTFQRDRDGKVTGADVR